MNHRLSLCGLVASSLLLPACATVTRGTSQGYTIESQPSEAKVALSTGEKCVTPCTLKLKRKPGFTATFTKDGYQPLEAKVESKLGGGGAVAGAGNILLGGVIGGIVDGTNGSMNNLFPSPLKVTLTPIATAPVAAAADPVATSMSAASDAAAAPAPSSAM